MTVTILLFATLKERAGIKQFTLDMPDLATVADVRTALAAQYPMLVESLPTAIASVNHEFAFPNDAVHAGDEIAFFPPVSGGSGEDAPAAWAEICRVAADPIDLNELTRAISTAATGAVCLFSGAVRGETNTDGSIVHTARLEYEAYEPMALAKMRQVIAEIRAQWPLVQGVAVVQRVGLLAIGEPTVLIACASGHRDQGCFEAARYGIDRLKEIVPVWKKEIRPAGDAQADQWVEGHYMPTTDDVT
jgi:molybdopterin synthase catalytic subunit